jgi:hypothetical protein
MHAELGNRIREVGRSFAFLHVLRFRLPALQVSWLDAATRAVALKKWAAMTRNVGTHHFRPGGMPVAS